MVKAAELPPKKERYCQARARGEPLVESFKQSGYRIAPNDTAGTIARKARNLEALPEVVFRIGEIKALQATQQEAIQVAKRVEMQTQFDAEKPTLANTNKLAHDIYVKAMENDDLSNALKVLNFINHANQLAPNAIGVGSGRQRTNSKPNSGDVGGNYGSGTDNAGEDSTSGFDPFADGSDDGDGDLPTEGHTPFFRQSKAVGTISKKVRGKRSQQLPSGDVGSPGDADEYLSESTEGECE